MPRRRAKPQPHREFFKLIGSNETIATPCTCSRKADHWHTAPSRYRARVAMGATTADTAAKPSSLPR